MNKKLSKPKFIPPISTAASFLQSISKSPDSIRYAAKRASIIKEFIPDFPKEINSQIRPLNNNSLQSPKLPKFTRDISHLKDKLKASNSEKLLSLSPAFPILPTSVDHLKVLLDAQECHSRTSSRGGHLCHKEKCLEDFLDRSSDQIDVKKLKNTEENLKFNFQFPSTTGKQDVQNLKEWFFYMKEKYLKNVTEDTDELDEWKKKIENFGTIIRAGVKEVARQICLHSQERGEVLNELIDHFEEFFRIKNSHKMKELNFRVKELVKECKTLRSEKEKNLKEYTEHLNSLSNEIEAKKSNLILKEVEIDRLTDHVKKLKADKVYRIKKELETYNQMLRTFKDNRETVKEESSHKVDDFKTRKIMRGANETINQIILAKMKLVEKKKDSELARPKSVDDEISFKDIDCQVNIVKDSKDQMTFTDIYYQDVELETDELVDFINIEESEISENKNILISIGSNGIEGSNEKPKKKLVFKYRLKMEKGSQTDEKLLIELVKKEEEEIVNWMIKDRKDYLRNIQRQILNQKNQLSKVKGEVAQSKANLGDSLFLDNPSHSEASSVYEIEENQIDEEIEKLKKIGIITEDINIDSWKNGYYFGFDKGRIEGFTDGEKLGIEKADLDKELHISMNSPVIELKVPRKSIRKTTIAVEDLKRNRKITKFQEFNFQRKNLKSGTTVPGHKQNILDTFLSEPLSNIIKSTKISKKMVLKSISSIYSSAIAKKNSGLMDLADFTYEEFFSKYSQKTMIGKKYLEFVAALLKYPESRKVITFVKLFGIGKKLGLEDYVRLKESFIFIVNLFEKISKSTLGIIIDVDETSDYQFIPTIRALECSKEVIGNFVDPQRLQGVVDFIGNKSFQDPKKINKSGIISQELLADYLLDEVNNYYKKYIENIIQLFQGINVLKSLKKIHKKDVILLIKYISEQKFENLVGNNDPIFILDKFCKLSSGDDWETIEVIMDFCITNGFLTIQDTKLFYPQEISWEEARSIIENEILQGEEYIKALFENWKSLNIPEQYLRLIEKRLNDIIEFQDCNPSTLVLCWRIIFKEIVRISQKI